MHVTSAGENFIQSRSRQFIRAQQPVSETLQDWESLVVHCVRGVRIVGKVGRRHHLRPARAQERIGRAGPGIAQQLVDGQRLEELCG
jgi:hypothetical protein